MSWWRDRQLWGVLVLGAVLRVVPIALWPSGRCVRDECTYLKVATRLVDGEGMTPSAGWLWAPGYPALMAIHHWITGLSTMVLLTQIPVGIFTAALVYLLALCAFSSWQEARARQAALIAAFLFAASPTQAFYAINLWSETFYTALLLGVLLAMDRGRAALELARPWARPALAGVLLGGCVLFRGIATYALPVVALGFLWGRLRLRRAWIQALVFAASMFLTVAPYSVYATHKFETLIISDRTLGQMLWLGDNDFPPLSFDFGNGALSKRAFDRTTAHGRPHCGEMSEAIARDDCETKEGVAWIKAHPGEFLRRIPLRVAQMLTPHSMLTRHLRWGEWRGLPPEIEDVTVVWSALWSIAVIWGGALGICLLGEGALGATSAGILVYHVAAIAVLAGLSRYRVPLEPIAMVYLGGLLAAGRDALTKVGRLRWGLALAVLALLIPLVLWFLPAGFPTWRRW